MESGSGGAGSAPSQARADGSSQIKKWCYALVLLPQIKMKPFQSITNRD
jgi:hypothetical protein